VGRRLTNEELQEKLVRLVKGHKREREENDKLREAARIIFRRDQDNNNTPILFHLGRGKIYVKLTAQFSGTSYEELE
jgi:hypothetical protein